MIVEPKVKGFICTTAHPVGCRENIKRQIEYVKALGENHCPRKVLVIGASTGYGLAPESQLLLAVMRTHWVLCLKKKLPEKGLQHRDITIQKHLRNLQKKRDYMPIPLMEMHFRKK